MTDIYAKLNSVELYAQFYNTLDFLKTDCLNVWCLMPQQPVHLSMLSWRSFNSLPHNPDFLQPSEGSLLKTLWEMEKMLETVIFSFSHNVFYPSIHNFHFLTQIYFVVCKCFQFGP